MKLTKRQLRKLIMEMPMGGYFGSMHGGAGEDFISAVEVEAMKYPDHSIYIDDASNNPNEFMISSSRRDDAQGPQSHYLTSIHVNVYERDGMIYVDGQPFSSYAQAASKILEDLEVERQYSMMGEGLLREMDMMTLGQVAGGVIMSIASLFLILGPIALHGLMDGYIRGLFSENELRKMYELSRQDPEMGKQYMESILTEKGYDRGSGMLPTHHTAGRDAQPARDYTSQHGDILPPSDFDIDDL